MEEWMNMEEGKYDNDNDNDRRKACTSATLSATNFTYTWLGLNRELRGKSLRNDTLTHGTASVTLCSHLS
jgi:hypothetical protein